jgi:para-nitrobenzyl esterase
MIRSISRRELTKGMLAAGVLSSVRASAEPQAPEATTRQGRVRGFARNGAALFLGLPYGADTSGSRRFRPPQSPAAWQGVRDATKPGQRAPQVVGPSPPRDLGNYFTGGHLDEITAMPQPVGEDCLVVNVVTPAIDGRRRPVLFYIHGGGFTGGSGLTMTFGERFVVREDVVLVTVNHRLGALGYMYLGDVASELAEGNPGMLDLVAALRWVRDNIAAFGGDPEKVTLFGESGGGAKIGLLLAMPQAKGLFRAAVIQSGLLPEPLAPERATAATRTFMERVGAKDLAALQTLPFECFVGSDTPGSMPAADGRTLVAKPWAEAPNTAADIPLIIGYCKDETTLFSFGDASLFKLEWADVPTRLSAGASARFSAPVPADAAEDVVAAYRSAFPSDNPSDCFFRISSDLTFGRSMVVMADRKSAQRPPVYFYRMEFDTGFPPGLRALHTAELPMTVDLNFRPESAGLSKQISEAWAAFARTGDPNHSGLVRWRRYDPGSRQCMIFNVASRCGPDPQAVPRAVLFEALAATPLWSPL